jgi:hypothetical protein
VNGLKSDELRRYGDRYCTSKPELTEAIRKLETLQHRAQRHFRSAYSRSPRPAAVA